MGSIDYDKEEDNEHIQQSTEHDDKDRDKEHVVDVVDEEDGHIQQSTEHKRYVELILKKDNDDVVWPCFLLEETLLVSNPKLNSFL